jgi:hypothetical protein
MASGNLWAGYRGYQPLLLPEPSVGAVADRDGLQERSLTTMASGNL